MLPNPRFQIQESQSEAPEKKTKKPRSDYGASKDWTAINIAGANTASLANIQEYVSGHHHASGLGDQLENRPADGAWNLVEHLHGFDQSDNLTS